jgi:hypothetical protein
LISLFIFFIFFTVLAIYIFRADKTHLGYMSDLPLGDENTNSKTDSDL